MKNLKLMLAATVLMTSAYGSALSRKQEVTPPKRNHFLDFSTLNPENEVSFTIGVTMQGIRPTLSGDVGKTHFEPIEDNMFIQGEMLNYGSDYIPALSGTAIISDRASGFMMLLNISHYNLPATADGWVAQEGSTIALNTELEGVAGSTAYNRVNASFANEKTNVALGFGGFSLQYKNFGMRSSFGASLDQMKIETITKGIEDQNESLVNTFSNNQNSLGYGIYTSITPSVIIYESEFSAMYLTSELSYTGRVTQNAGSVVSYQSDLETEELSHTSNTSLEGTTFVNGCTKRLGLALVSKPQEKDTSFFTMELGVGSDTEFAYDLISKVYSGAAGNLNTTYAFLSISYSM